MKTIRLAVIACVALAACATPQNPAVLDQMAQSTIRSSFRDQGIARIDRLNQDEVQLACSAEQPPGEGAHVQHQLFHRQRQNRVRTQVARHWHKALRRRSQHDGTPWMRTSRLAERWLPHARIQHPWPEVRFDVRTRGKSRVR